MADSYDAAGAALDQAHAMEELAAQIGELAKVLKEIQATGERTDRRGRWTSAVGLVVAGLLMAGVTVLWSGVNERNDRAEQSAQILKAIEASQAVITGCTSPGHPCYDENQARSNARLAPIIAVLCDTLPPEKRRPPCPT